MPIIKSKGARLSRLLLRNACRALNPNRARNIPVSPLKGDFAGLPPLYFNAGSTEIFRDCSIYAANKARAHGIDVVCNIWEDMPHCFPISLQHILPEAKQANQELSDFLVSHLTKD